MSEDKIISKYDNPFNALEKLFHEPNRLAIMSALCAAGVAGMTFNELRDSCDLTDGNLNRHLKALEEAQAVRTEKTFVGVKPRTTMFVTETGHAGFVEYLDNLERVLKAAADAAKSRKKGGERVKYVFTAQRPAKA